MVTESGRKHNMQFGRTDSLYKRTLFRMTPMLLLASMSTFLITMVDGLMVGNADGSKALAAVSAMGPFLTVVGAITAVVHSGVSIVLPQLEGENDIEKELGGYRATFHLTLSIAAAVAVIQIPVAAAIIHSMGFDPDVTRDAWAYTSGLFLANPVDCISTVGTFVLVSTGNADCLLMLSLVEGFADLGIDYITVFRMDMGPLGAGLGTAVGIWLRCIITIILIKRKTRFFSFQKQKCGEAAKRMLRAGFPGGLKCASNAVMLWIFSWLVMNALGIDGMNVKAVLGFVCSLSSMLLSSVMQSASTIIGFRYGVRDFHGVDICFRTTAAAISILMTALMLLWILFPEFAFSAYGIDSMPSYGAFAVIMCAFVLPFDGWNSLIFYFFQLQERDKTVAVLNVLNGMLIPVITAFSIWLLIGGEYIWISYAAGSIIVFIINVVLLFRNAPDGKIRAEDRGTLSLSLTRENMSFLLERMDVITNEWKLSKSALNRLTLIIEEIAAYSKADCFDSDLKTDLLITVSEDVIRIVTMDNGVEIPELDDSSIGTKTESGSTNYDILKSISDDLTYQRIMKTNVITASINCA